MGKARLSDRWNIGKILLKVKAGLNLHVIREGKSMVIISATEIHNELLNLPTNINK